MLPRQLDLYQSNMAEIYNSLEGEIIKIIIKRLNSGQSILDWQARSFENLNLFNREVMELIGRVTNIAEPKLLELFEETGRFTVEQVDRNVPNPDPYVSNAIDDVMRGYYNQASVQINDYVNQTLVSGNLGYGTATKAYVDVLNRSTALFNTGILTEKQALEKAIQELAQKGLDSGFVDKGGRTWSVDRYVRTVLRTTMANTMDEVRKERMDEYGMNLVVVTSHVGAREACTRIQSNVVDLRPMAELPADSKYRSIYDPYWKADYLEPHGHHGINCMHLHIPFTEGFSENNQPKIDDELNERVRENRTKQRRLERDVVKYKKNKMVSEYMGNDEEAKKWQKKVSGKQKQIREHLKHNGEYLSRSYEREKVYTPIEQLV